jgi:hypothetical protein
LVGNRIRSWGESRMRLSEVEEGCEEGRDRGIHSVSSDRYGL